MMAKYSFEVPESHIKEFMENMREFDPASWYPVLWRIYRDAYEGELIVSSNGDLDDFYTTEILPNESCLIGFIEALMAELFPAGDSNE
jgi:hypothetical protein